MARGSASGSFADGEKLEGFFDALVAGFRLFGTLNPVSVLLLVGVGESGERCCLIGRFGEGGMEIGGNGEGARGVVKGELDLDGVAGGRACSGKNVFADAEDVDASAGHQGVAKSESVDGGADGDLAIAAEDFRNAERDLEVCPGGAWTAANELGFEPEGIRWDFGHGCVLRWGGV
jgi:hypothetical protein